MKHKMIAGLLIAVIAISCNSGKKATDQTASHANSGNDPTAGHRIEDGKSFETAILIQEKSETPGVHAEYQWIRDHYSNYKVVQQSLADHGKKPFDIITIEFGDSTKQEVYFDISKFFGHL
jgi:hypothetical protein